MPENTMLDHPLKQVKQPLSWAEAMSKFEEAQPRSGDVGERYDAAFEEFVRLRPDPDMIPKGELPFYCERDILKADLDEMWKRFLANEGRTWWAPDLEDAKAKKRAAIDSVKAYREQYAHARAVTDLDRLEEEVDAAADALAAAEDVLVKTPAPNGAALLWKIKHLFGPADILWDEAYTAQTYADAERLLGAEA